MLVYSCYSQSNARVEVATGPLYLPHQRKDGTTAVTYRTIGSPPVVAVPTHFFKVVIVHRPAGKAGSQKGEEELHIAAFVIPNAPISADTLLPTFLRHFDEVEEAAGMELFPGTMTAARRGLQRELELGLFQQLRRAKPKPANIPPTLWPTQPAKTKTHGDSNKAITQATSGTGNSLVVARTNSHQHLCSDTACELPPGFPRKQPKGAQGK